MRIVRSHFRSRFALCSELCVQNSCVQPAAMPEPASVSRIGPKKHKYFYTYVDTLTYKCERGSDWKGIDEVLWMMKAPDGLWYAFDAQQDTVPTSIDHAKVRFVSTGADAHIPGWHPWTMTMSNDAEMGFKTTLIED